MRFRVFVWSLFVVLAVSACSAPRGRLSPAWDWPTIRQELLRLANTGEESTKTLQLHPRHAPVTVTSTATTKGNGFIRILNLNIRAFDDHDDGSFYAGGFLQVDLVDLDDDQDLDLIVSGVLLSTEDQSDKITRHEPIVYMYRYDQHRQLFAEAFNRSPMEAVEIVSPPPP